MSRRYENKPLRELMSKENSIEDSEVIKECLPEIKIHRASLNMTIKEMLNTSSRTNFVNVLSSNTKETSPQNRKKSFISYLSSHLIANQLTRRNQSSNRIPPPVNVSSPNLNSEGLGGKEMLKSRFLRNADSSDKQNVSKQINESQVITQQAFSNDRNLVLLKRKSEIQSLRKQRNFDFVNKYLSKERIAFKQSEVHNKRENLSSTRNDDNSKYILTQRFKKLGLSNKTTEGNKIRTMRENIGFPKTLIHSKETNFKTKNFIYKIMEEPKKLKTKNENPVNVSTYRNLFPQAISRQVLKLPHKSILKVTEFPTMELIDRPDGPFLLIFGGVSSYVHHEFFICNLRDQSVEIKNKSSDHQIARFGHSMNIIKNRAYVYGGSNSFQNERYMHQAVNYNSMSMEFFIVYLSTWIVKEIKSVNFVQPPNRKFHASFSYEETFIFAIAGISSGDKFLKDIWMFDIGEKSWHEFRIEQVDKELDIDKGLAHHKLVCMSPAIKDKQINKNINLGDDSLEGGFDIKSNLQMFLTDKKHIALDAYMFGGVNNKNKIISSDLWQLCMKNKHFYFSKIRGTNGCRPEPRHSHSMSKLSSDQLAVYGGRGEGDLFLSTLYIFKFKIKEWAEVNLSNKEWAGGVSSHSATVVDNALFLFGGVQYHGFAEPNVYYSILI
jgi:hypothetical protein